MLAPLLLRSPSRGTQHTCVCICVHTMVLVRGGGGRVARAGRPACCVTLPPVLMAYREREEGGFLGGFTVGGCAGVAALFTSFSLSILGPSIPVVYAAAGSGSRSLAIPCSHMLACVGIPLALFVPSGLWFVCLVAVVSSPVACGSVSRFPRGEHPSYHRFFPLGIPSYHSCSVPRCWRLLVLRVFFGGVHIFSGVGGFIPR